MISGNANLQSRIVIIIIGKFIISDKTSHQSERTIIQSHSFSTNISNGYQPYRDDSHQSGRAVMISGNTNLSLRVVIIIIVGWSFPIKQAILSITLQWADIPQRESAHNNQLSVQVLLPLLGNQVPSTKFPNVPEVEVW